METDAFVLKKSLPETLKKIDIGGSMIIKNRDFKANQVRTTATRLKNLSGLEFTVSDRGRVDEVIVTRLK